MGAGVEYYRLALLLRRIADHVENLLERTGAADEHALLDEITLAYGLMAALLGSTSAETGHLPDSSARSPIALRKHAEL